MKFITRYWYQSELEPPAYLKVLSRVFSALSTRRRRAFLNAQNRAYRAPIPVIVIGNITVGGTGKTPLLIALSHFLQEKNLNVGIVSRGYGGKSNTWPVEVLSDSNVTQVGDEPLLIARKTRCPLFVGPKRCDDIKALLIKYPDTDVILSDDGMQHYAMQRDIEIAVVDSKRLFGNQKLLPAGPLREPMSRLESVDVQVINGGDLDACGLNEFADKTFSMQFVNVEVYRLNDKSQKKNLSAFFGQQLHAIAGIGHPQRFFDMLRLQGLDIIPHEYADHYQYNETDFGFDSSLPLIMTEKDAVKCAGFKMPECWVVSVDAQFSDGFYETVFGLLSRHIHQDT